MSVHAIRAVIARRLEHLSEATIILAVFTAALFFSALLLFSVQPSFTKMVLPTLGGSPSVWAVSMCFFQAALLGGYCYAYLINRYLPMQIAPLVHLALLAVALLALPFGLPSDAEPPGGDAYLWLIGILAVGVGLPFFAVSANAPLLQAWFARTGHPHAADPYFLYGASNLGSLLALLSYPVLLEPTLGLAGQAQLWSAGFVLLVLFIAACALLLRRVDSTGSGVTTTSTMGTAADQNSGAVSWTARAWWIGLAFVPSGLLVAYTSHITTDVASAPFLWVIPLATFLGTFVLIFRDRPVIPHHWLVVAQPVFVVLALIELIVPRFLGIVPGVAIGFAAFFVTVMVAHGELYKRRPQSQHLTEFYLWMSTGGVLGGVFAAIITPQLFNGVYEYPLLLAAGMLCRSVDLSSNRDFLTGPVVKWLTFGLIGLALLVGFAAIVGLSGLQVSKVLFVVLGLAVGIMIIRGFSEPRKQVAYVAVLATVVVVLPGQSNMVFAGRSFYGVHRVGVADNGQIRYLLHGTTVHGVQRIKEADGTPVSTPRPATYYYEDGPMAHGVRVARQVSARRGEEFSVGVVGVGAGSLACHAKAIEKWRFYEIDPMVVAIATDPKLFNFFSNCRPNPDMVIGDARLTVSKEQNGKFDYLVVDAFSSDAVPVHLMTREALSMYLDKVTANGIVALHISNMHMDLPTVAAATARSIPGVHAVLASDLKPSTTQDRSPNQVMFLSRSEASLMPLLQREDTEVAPVSDASAWTDDYSNVALAIWRKYIK